MKKVKVAKVTLTEKMDSRDRLVKEKVIAMLIDEGYGTYARRLKEFDFVVTEMYHGHYIEVAAMFPQTGEIVINPAFLADEKTFSQLSVVVRHELLHFLLMHERRLYDHLKATDPDFERTYRKSSIHQMANFAMDWDLSREGYDDHDKEVVRTMTLNGRVIGGLILEDDHPEWLDKPMEEIFDLLRKEHEERLKKNPPKPKSKLKIKKASHSQEYTDAYNKALNKFKDPKYSDGDIAVLLGKLANGEDIDLD